MVIKLVQMVEIIPSVAEGILGSSARVPTTDRIVEVRSLDTSFRLSSEKQQDCVLHLYSIERIYMLYSPLSLIK